MLRNLVEALVDATNTLEIDCPLVNPNVISLWNQEGLCFPEDVDNTSCRDNCHMLAVLLALISLVITKSSVSQFEPNRHPP